jgi:hypothetical protein
MRRGLDSLNRLNRRAREEAFTVEDLDWSLAVDRSKPWEPDEMGALWFVPAFAELDAEQRLRCNQLHALGVSEQFVWFEGQLIRAINNVLAARGLPTALDEALRHFVEEEGRHIEMFWRLLGTAEPAWYGERAPRLFRPGRLQQVGMDLMSDHPSTLLAWMWLAIFVEERTLFWSRCYLGAEKRSPGSIDPLHTQVHRFHFLDEVRHHQLDQHLLGWLYDRQPRWKKSLSAFMFRQFVRVYVAARRSATRIAGQLAREFPALRERVVPQMLVELQDVARNPVYHQKNFSIAAHPHTFVLLAEYPEHEALWRFLPAAQRSAS